MLALVIVRKNRDVKIRFCMEIGVEKFRYCLRVGTFGTEGAVRKHGGAGILCDRGKGTGGLCRQKRNGSKWRKEAVCWMIDKRGTQFLWKSK